MLFRPEKGASAKKQFALQAAVLGLGLLFGAALALGAWTSYDYSICCTKCLLGEHVVGQRFLGISFRTTTVRSPAADYEKIHGQRCQHIFRKYGWTGRVSHSIRGSRVGCGNSAEGIFFAPRLEAVSATYTAARTIGEVQLARETLDLIDTLIPADAQVARSTVVALTAV